MRKLITLGIVFLLVIAALAENNGSSPITIGEISQINSQILNEERTLWIYTPPGYENSDTGYPVMYLLDGTTHFHHTTGIIQFFNTIGRMPQMIVIALPNTDRTRDLTPAFSDTSIASRFSTAGSAQNFLRFMREELFPYVEKNYRTQPYKVLVGHSFGGLFVVNAFLTETEMFNAFIAISPSLWWDNQRLLKDGENFLKANPNLNKFLYLSVGNEPEERMMVPFRAFVDILKKHAPSGLTWGSEIFENDTHGSTPHKTTYNALEMLYSEWQLPLEIVRSGSLEDFDKHYEKVSKRFGYEVKTPETAVNQLGYRFIGENKFEEAIATLKRNTEVYPKSANVYDSLGDAYDAAGQFELAKNNYEKAYHLAQETNHPNTQIFKRNYERLQKQLTKK